MALLLAVSLSAQAIFEAEPLPSPTMPALKKELSDYQLIRLDSRGLLQLFQDNTSAEMELSLPGQPAWRLSLAQTDIRSRDYRLQIATVEGTKSASGYGALALAGKILAPEPGNCRLTLNEGFVYGILEIGETTWYIEPARRFGWLAGSDTYLVYRAEDVLDNAEGRCAAVAAGDWKAEAPVEKVNADCISLDIALAADYSMFAMFEDIATLENYTLGILNNVHTNYDDEFEQPIRFAAVTLYAVTCQHCDPWDPGFEPEPVVDYLDYLWGFRSWGNNDGFGAVTYDVASLWTGRELTDGNGNQIGGGGYFGGMCRESRYNLLRRYSENAALMRTLQAHEIGHNFDARHDASGTMTIMAPRIRDVNAWSATSQSVIQNFINSVVLGSGGCAEGCAEQLPPQARFSVNASSGCAPFTTKFTNQMANADSWTWHFPGGTPATSLEAHPTVTYAESGIYEVQLIASNPIGQDTMTESLITVRGEPRAAFAANVTPGSNAVTFSNEASDTEHVIWDFGDGTTTSQANPTHVYEQDGTYEVRLVALSSCGSDATTQTVTIITAPAADFAATTTSGCAPLRVQFDNLSSANATDFEWQFSGASLAITTQRSPTVEFTAPGTYTVTLTARNAAGEAVATKMDFITVLESPGANFNFNVNEKTVRFTNFSQQADTYRWLFGDGTTSEAAEPEHTYADAGMYEVLLIAGNACGSDTSRQLVQIGGAAPVAKFSGDVLQGCAPFTVQFFENAGGNVASRRWYFPGGEPAFSTQQNPVVAYAEAGDYPVALAVENIWGQDSVFMENYISVSASPSADFTYAVDAFEVQFAPDARRADWQYAWDFGDGNTSTQLAPAHTYARSGMYEVELAVTNWCGTQVASESVVLAATSITKELGLSAINLAPNPNNGHFQLALKGKPQREVVIQLTNTLGQTLHEQRVNFASGEASLQFNFSDWKAGRYWLRVQGAQVFAIRPFVIQKP